MAARRQSQTTDEKKCAQIAVESILMWGEAEGVPDLPQETARAIAADVTYRIRQVLSVSGQFLRHTKRRRLTPDDISRTLKWMDVPPVMGYSGVEPVEWVSMSEVGVHVPHEPSVNLASTALSGDIFHQPGSPCVRGEWAHVMGHTMVKGENGEDRVPAPLPLSPEHTQYYQTLFSVIGGSSNTLFKTMCEDVSTSPGLGSLVGPIVGGVVRGAERARQKPIILRRILLIVRSLLKNPHLHLGPQNYMRELVNVLVYCIVTERKSTQDTQMIRSLASNILLQVVRSEGGCGSVWESVVSGLGSVMGSSSTRPWGQQVGALTGLMSLGAPALLHALLPIAHAYHARLTHATSQPPSHNARDTQDAHQAMGLLLAGLVKIATAFIKSLPNTVDVTLPKGGNIEDCKEFKNSRKEDRSTKQHNWYMKKLKEIYKLGEEAFGSAFVVQVPSIYLCLSSDCVPSFLHSSVYRDQAISGQALLNAPPNKKPQKQHFSPSKLKSKRSEAYAITQVFEDYLPLPDKKLPQITSVRGCIVRTSTQLKRRVSSIPKVKRHPDQPLLQRYINSRPTGCMPHNIFTRPLHPRLLPCSSMQYLIL
ncbi:unnamed protein product, partial [Meganyctiphanes norvegica]